MEASDQNRSSNDGTYEGFNGWLFWRFELPAIRDEELFSALQIATSPAGGMRSANGSSLSACASQRSLGNGDSKRHAAQYGEDSEARAASVVSLSTNGPHQIYPAKIDHWEHEYWCRTACSDGGEHTLRSHYEEEAWNISLSNEQQHPRECHDVNLGLDQASSHSPTMGNLSSQPGEKKSKSASSKDAERTDAKSSTSKFRFGKGESKPKSSAAKSDNRPQSDVSVSTQRKRRSSTDIAVVESTPSPGSSLSSSVYVDTHSHLPTPVEGGEDDSVLEGDSQILDDGTATLQDASPGSLSDITVFCDEGKQEVMSNVLKRPQPSSSQSLPGTPGDTHLESNFSTMGFSTVYESRYRTHGGETESSSYSSGGRDLSTSSSSSSVDIHDLSGALKDFSHKQQRGSFDSSVPPSTLPFTLTQHRKVVLPPHKFVAPPPLSAQNGKAAISGSEECLRPANLYGNNVEHQSSPSRRHSSYGDVPPLDGNVLRKVASLTLDKATIDSKVNRPKFVPEKLDFSLYEKF
ncbi:hypothetical protein X975_21114, partial [Stegodyphus mimosarum]